MNLMYYNHMKLQEYIEIAKDISLLYNEMDQKNDLFSSESGLKCVSNCNGQCCLSSDVEIKAVELLPLIIELHQSNELLNYYFLAKSNVGNHCIFFQNGRCSVYLNRAVLCRLFGYASVYNKEKNKILSVCSLIKNESQIKVSQNIVEKAANLVDYSSRMESYIPYWNNNPMKINNAFIYAAENFLNSIQYE